MQWDNIMQRKSNTKNMTAITDFTWALRSFDFTHL